MDVDKADKEKDAANDAEGDGGSDDEYFEVEKILDEIEEDGQRYYTIRWVNYGPEYDSNEPAEAIAHCTDIVAEWEKEKEARKANAASRERTPLFVSIVIAERKRSRSVGSGDESGSVKGSTSGRRRKKSKGVRSSGAASLSKRPREDEVVEDDDSDVSKGTDDSFMNELKSKNEGTYKWEDVRRGRNESTDAAEEDEEDNENEYASLKEQERQRRKSKRKAMTPTKENKRSITSAKKNPPPKPATSNTTSPLALHFPFGSRSMNSIRPAKRKPGESVNAIQPDERRQRNVTNLTMSHRYNIKKKQRQEPPPDANAIAVFRPDAVLTAAARTMKSGRGYEKAIGDIDTAISISQGNDQKTERKHLEPVEKGAESPKQRARRSSVTDAITSALKFRDENKTRATNTSPVISSPASPVHFFAEPIEEDGDPHALTDAWLKNAPVPVHTSPRRASFSAESSRLPEQLPHRHNSVSSHNVPRILPASDSNQPPVIDILPMLPEDSSRTWTGELLFSKERSSFGPIRLFIPQSSIRIKQLPKLSSSICLTKMLSAQYLSQKWFSKTAHPTKKPECLLVEFQNKDAQTQLVDTLRKTDSAGLVCEENFTLIFFFKHNERLRMLFNSDASSGPIGVASLEGVKIDALDVPPPRGHELLNHRRMPYNAILLSDSVDQYVPHLRDLPYVLHSPSESLETTEMEMILATRGAIPALEQQPPGIVLIHRSLLPCLNYIPDLTDNKRRHIDILLFGSYLDYEMEQRGEVKSVFGWGVSKIFPSAGLICFTVDHLLENPQHIKEILAYNKSRPTWNIILPSNMVDKFHAIEQRGKHNIPNFGDILFAIALLREQISLKSIVIEEYDFHDDFGFNSYLPFMNFLQNRDYGSVRRFLLIHPTPISGSQWASCGNGIEVYTAEEFARHFKAK